MGFYTFTAWPAAAVVFSLPVLAQMGQFFKKKLLSCLVYFSTVFVFIAPIIWRMEQEGYGDYLRRVSGPGVTFGIKRLEVLEQYLAAPFFGVGPNVSFYSPVWGGFLNPVLGTLFFLGLREAFRQKKIYLWWFLSALVILWLPGLLTNGQELFRILLLCPFLLAGAAWGLSILISSLSRRSAWLTVCSLLLVSLGLDGYHLFVVYPDLHSFPQIHQFWRPVELAEATGMIESHSQTQGPLVIFNEFSLKPSPAFSVATYGFDALENPRLASVPPKTAVIMTDPNYQPFLERRFPEGDWHWFTPNNPDKDSGLLVGFVPYTSSTKEILDRWRLAHQVLREERDRSQYENIDYDWRLSVEHLSRQRGLFSGDPFLESIYWEQSAFYQSFNGHVAETVRDLQLALKKGYRSANLYYSLGMFLSFEGRTKEARAAFEAALKLPVNRTAAALRLKELVLSRLK